MKDKLIQFLSTFPQLGKEEIEVIANTIPVVSFKKGDLLVSNGEVPAECYFVLKGIVRQYKIVDGEEKTTEFYTEKNGTVSSSHYTDQTPFEGYLKCSEDCLLIAGTMEIDKENYEKFPVLQAITRKMIESDLNDTKKKFSRFVTSSPKERYLNLMETQPDLLNRVPLHQIASYLGMTAESLSRIRKRITEKPT